jgi:hypothetical protein
MQRTSSVVAQPTLYLFLILLTTTVTALASAPFASHNDTTLFAYPAASNAELEDPLALMASNEQVEAIIAKKVPVSNTPREGQTNAIEKEGSGAPPPTAARAEGVIDNLLDVISTGDQARGEQSFDSKSMFSLFKGGLTIAPDAVKALEEGLRARGGAGDLTLEEVENTNDLPEHVPLTRGPASYFLLKKGGQPNSYLRIADGAPYVLFVPLQPPAESTLKPGVPAPVPVHQQKERQAAAKGSQPGPAKQQL